MNNEFSLPKEWVHILSAEKPLLSLEYLMNEATVEDVYDSLEIMEVLKYMRIEAEKQNNDNQS